jgi:hypothetical protein
MSSLNQAIERIRAREKFPPPGIVSVRQLLSRFSLSPALSVRALMASDLIAQRYDADGRSNGFVGFPMGPVQLTDDGGAMQPFSSGKMVMKDDKVIPIVTFEAEVRFLGFRCNDESDHDRSTPSD